MEIRKTETQTPKNLGPAAPIGALVEKLVPAVFRDEVSGDWRENYISPARYAMTVAKGLPPIVLRQIRNTLDPVFVIGEACVLFISFNGGPLLPLGIVLVVSLTVLILRDAYTDPAKRSQKEAVTHAITAAAAAFVSQAVLVVMAPSWALPSPLMMRGAAISMMMMSGWRLVFYLRKSPKDPREVTAESYKATWQINILWLTGCMVLITTGENAVPATVPWRDMWLVLLPMVVFTTSYRLQVNALDREEVKLEWLDVSGNAYKKQLQVKRELLFTGNNSWLELLYFVLLAAPLCVAFWRWWSDDPSVVLIDWQQLGANLGAFVSLSVLWIYIKRMNQKTARSIQQEIDVLANQEKK